MVDRPILFSTPMVCALLDGTKTQTRRVLVPQPREWQIAVSDVSKPRMEVGDDGTDIPDRWGQLETVWSGPLVSGLCEPDHEVWHPIKTPRIGDRLWVREAWRAGFGYNGVPPREMSPAANINYLATPDTSNKTWGGYRPGMFMPRWASRLTLTVTNVRIQRLDDISEGDALAEGITREERIIGAHCAGGRHTEVWEGRYFFHDCPDEGFESAVDAYAALWGQINGADAWGTNPFVCAITFAVRKGNVDA